MQPPFFNIADLSVNFPPDFDLYKTADTPEGLTNIDAVLEEFIHHYTTLGTSQGIFLTLLRVASLTLLSASTIHKTQIMNETVKIPLGPFYSDIQHYFKGLNKKPASHQSKTTRLTYDYLIAAAMNLYEWMYGYIDVAKLTICPSVEKKYRLSFKKETAIYRIVEREIPIINIQNNHGQTENVTLGFQSIMEGYARAVADLAILVKANTKPQLIQEVMENLTLRLSQTENIPHYINWNFIKTYIYSSDPVTYEIILACSYIALMYSPIVMRGDIPHFFRSVSNENIKKIIVEFEKISHPGTVFLAAVSAAKKILKQNKHKHIEILEFTNMICNELKIDPPEIMIEKLKIFLINLREKMDPVYRSTTFFDMIIDISRQVVEFASENIEAAIRGEIDPEKLSILMLTKEQSLGAAKPDRFSLVLYASILEQLFSSNRILCYPKQRNESNPLCGNSKMCPHEFLIPSQKCEEGFLASLNAVIGNHEKIQSK